VLCRFWVPGSRSIALRDTAPPEPSLCTVRKMHSEKKILQHQIWCWAENGDFDAPYGVLLGETVSKSGRGASTVTFGRARTLDATVEIYSRTFFLLKTSHGRREVFRSFEDLQRALEDL
jgi:hypothetical protein